MTNLRHFLFGDKYHEALNMVDVATADAQQAVRKAQQAVANARRAMQEALSVHQQAVECGLIAGDTSPPTFAPLDPDSRTINITITRERTEGAP